MKRWPLLSAIVIAVALALLVGACGGGNDDDDATATPPASETPFGGGGATPPSAGQLPPEFYDCLADQGYDIESPDEVHSVPQQALQACFGSLHSGGGTP